MERREGGEDNHKDRKGQGGREGGGGREKADGLDADGKEIAGVRRYLTREGGGDALAAETAAVDLRGAEGRRGAEEGEETGIPGEGVLDVVVGAREDDAGVGQEEGQGGEVM